jgi:hypothetical protein
MHVMSQNQFDKKSQAWSALFSEPMSDLVKRYTASVFFDKRLWLADITGSLAHAEMLAAQGIINAAGPRRYSARHGADPLPRSNPARLSGSSIWKTCT